jgi:hypothetical protein
MQDQLRLSSRLEKLEPFSIHEESSSGQPNGWLDELKAELEAKRRAEAEAQYKRDALITRLMFELNRVRCVELLEEMNRELVNREGRVEPVFTDKHELCFSWPVAGGRNQITVGADFNEATNEIYLLVSGQQVIRIPPNEAELKKALIKSFREPLFNVYRW